MLLDEPAPPLGPLACVSSLCQPPIPGLGLYGVQPSTPPSSDLVSSLPRLPALPSQGSWWGSLEW